MFNVLQFKRMNSTVELFVPTHVAVDHQPGTNEQPGVWSAKDLGLMSWMESVNDPIQRFATAIDEATYWITSDKMFVAFSNVPVSEHESIEGMEAVQSFFYDQQMWPGHPLFQSMSSRPSTLSIDDVRKLSLEGVEPSKTLQCFAVVTLSDQHPQKGEYLCVLTAVSEGDWEEEVFQVSFMFLKLKPALESPRFVCSFRAECPGDVDTLAGAIWSLRESDGLDVTKTILRMNYTYQFPTLEPTVQIESSDVSIEHVEKLLRNIEDSHVMLDTLRPVPLSENSLKRDYGRE